MHHPREPNGRAIIRAVSARLPASPFWVPRDPLAMTAKPRLTKVFVLLGGATLLAAAMATQSSQSSLGNSNSARWMSLRFQMSGLGGGTSGGSTGGNGGVINGPAPRRLSRVRVTTPGVAPGP